MSDFISRLKSSVNAPAGAFTLSGGFTVYLRRWTVGERLAVAGVLRDDARHGTERLTHLLALSLCDERNQLVCPDGAPTPDLLSLPLGADADAIVEAALAANGFGEKKTPTPPTNSGPSRS